MKIGRVRANNRRRAFEVESRGKTYPFPYAIAQPEPSSTDRVLEVHPDPELGREAFTYQLESGAEGSVHMDSVLEYNQDPGHLADLMLHELTVAARSRFERAALSTREVSRRLGTSPTQLYRLLDPTNHAKSVRQMLSLLSVLGCDVQLVVKDRAKQRTRNVRTPRSQGASRTSRTFRSRPAGVKGF